MGSPASYVCTALWQAICGPNALTGSAARPASAGGISRSIADFGPEMVSRLPLLLHQISLFWYLVVRLFLIDSGPRLAVTRSFHFPIIGTYQGIHCPLLGTLPLLLCLINMSINPGFLCCSVSLVLLRRLHRRRWQPFCSIQPPSCSQARKQSRWRDGQQGRGSSMERCSRPTKTSPSPLLCQCPQVKWLLSISEMC